MGVKEFCFYIVVIINLMLIYLDYYGFFEDYVVVKWNI